MTTFIVTVTLAVIVVLVVRRAFRGQSRFADGHVGKIGERLDLMVTLVDVVAFQKWGRTRHRFRFQDAQGHCFVRGAISMRSVFLLALVVQQG